MKYEWGKQFSPTFLAYLADAINEHLPEGIQAAGLALVSVESAEGAFLPMASVTEGSIFSADALQDIEADASQAYGVSVEAMRPSEGSA